MPSVLNVDTIVAANGTDPVALTKQSAAKAWCQFSTEDNPPNLDGSFGVSSLTDSDTEVKVHLTSAMSDAFYAPVGSAALSTTNPGNRNLSLGCQSTTEVDTEMYATSNLHNTGVCHVGVLGDLA